MKNADIAYLLEMDENDPNVVFKIRSYKKAADTIANSSSNIEEVYAKQGLKGLMQIPSIGKAIALKIEEYLKTGKIRYLSELKSKAYIDIDQFYGLEGLGARTIKVLYDKLGVRDLVGLERAASEGKIRSIRGWAEKSDILNMLPVDKFLKCLKS